MKMDTRFREYYGMLETGSIFPPDCRPSMMESGMDSSFFFPLPTAGGDTGEGAL
jgi:hypothetical protein